MEPENVRVDMMSWLSKAALDIIGRAGVYDPIMSLYVSLMH